MTTEKTNTTETSASESRDVVMPEFVEVPITQGFRRDLPPIGTVKILKSALPEDPNWILSLGYKIGDGVSGKYELMELSLISDSEFKGYLEQKA